MIARSKRYRRLYVLVWGLWVLDVGYITTHLLWSRHPFVAIGGGVGFLLYAIAIGAYLRRQKRLAEALRAPGPEAALAVDRAWPNKPWSPLWQAERRARVFTVYGDIARARDNMTIMAGASATAARTLELQAAALLHYVTRDDVEAGLVAARTAAGPASTSAFRDAVLSYPLSELVYALLGEVLVTRSATPELADELLAQAKRIFVDPTKRLVYQWAAAHALAAVGRSSESVDLLQHIRTAAPGCTPLHQLCWDAP